MGSDLAGFGVPASDFGYLLHKNPARPQAVEVANGTAHVIYPEATDERCTAAVILEVDPIGLVRGRKAPEGFTLGQYVNDRPYAASSLLAVALGKLFRTAMNGRCDARPELAAQPIPLEIHLPALPCAARRGPGAGTGSGVELAERMFAPLGWTVDARPVPLDPEVPAWGDSRYVDLRLRGTIRLADALNHLYVLLPVLDDAKHYWVGPDEVDKLVRAGGGWLGSHPEKELISHRYLAHRRYLADTALERLAEVDGLTLTEDEPVEGSVALATQRRLTVIEVLSELGARRIADLGCGEGALVGELLKDPMVAELVGADVSSRALLQARRRLHYDACPTGSVNGSG